MVRRPPRSTRTDTHFPNTTLFRALPVCSTCGHRMPNHAKPPEPQPVRIATMTEPAPARFNIARYCLAENARLRGDKTAMILVGADPETRSEERRVGKACVRPCKIRWAPGKRKNNRYTLTHESTR